MAIVLVPAYLYDYNRMLKRYSTWTKQHGGRVQARIYPARGSSILFPYRGYEIEIKMIPASKGNIVPAYLIANLFIDEDRLWEFSLSPKKMLENYFEKQFGERIPINEDRFDSRFNVFAPDVKTAMQIFTAEVRSKLLQSNMNTTSILSTSSSFKMRINLPASHAWDGSEDSTYGKFIALLQEILDLAWQE